MRRKTLLPFVLGAALILGAWWWSRGPADPVYQGKRLSERLHDLRQPFSDAGLAMPDTQHNLDWDIRWRQLKLDALPIPEIRAMGQPAVQWLAYALEHGRHEQKPLRYQIYDHGPDSLHRFLPASWSVIDWQEFSYDERAAAAKALEILGPSAAPAIPALERKFRDPTLQMSCLYALYAIGPPAWPAIDRCFAGGDAHARRNIVATLPFRLPPEHHPDLDRNAIRVAEMLLGACHDSSYQVRAVAARTLLQCWPEGTPALDVRSPGQRSIALPPAARRRAIELLLALFRDAEVDVRTQAAATLGALQSEAAVLIPQLLVLLDDPDPAMRAGAARALGHLDSEKKRSVPRLQSMAAGDSDPTCRARAHDALATIESPPNNEPAR